MSVASGTRGGHGIALLSGGQSGELASARLNAMNVTFKSHLPWAVAFSSAAPSSNLLWTSGQAKRGIWHKRNKHYFIGQGVVAPSEGANTMPRLQSSNKQRPYGRSGMSDGIARDTRPYWNLAHYDLRFWVGMVFMFAALALLPHG